MLKIRAQRFMAAKEEKRADMFTVLLIFSMILSYGSSEPNQCGEYKVPCGAGECCDMTAESNCDPSKCGANMECNILNKCQCKSPFMEFTDVDTNVSTCTFPLPAACENDTDCGPSAQCAETKTCECTDGYNTLESNDESKLFRYCEQSQSRQEGKVSQDFECPADYEKCSGKCCGENGQCLKGECLCGQGFSKQIDASGNIVECANEEDPEIPVNFIECLDECAANSQCLLGTCVCNKGYHTAQNSVECIVDEDVPSMPKEAVAPAVEEILTCTTGYERCSQECCGANSQCKGGQCSCNDGFQETQRLTSNHVECQIEKRQDHSVDAEIQCDIDIEFCAGKCCVLNGQCLDEQCVCREGFQQTLDKVTNYTVCEANDKEDLDVGAVPDVPKCEPGYAQCSEKCCGPNTECLAEKCVCQTGYQDERHESGKVVICESRETFNLGIFEHADDDADTASIKVPHKTNVAGSSSDLYNLEDHAATTKVPPKISEAGFIGDLYNFEGDAASIKVPHKTNVVGSISDLYNLEDDAATTVIPHKTRVAGSISDLFNFEDDAKTSVAGSIGDLYNFEDDAASTVVPNKTSVAGSIGDLYNFENFCLDLNNQCSKVCCDPNAICGEDRKCVCPPGFMTSHSRVMKATSCVKPPAMSAAKMTYTAIGGTCMLLALLFLCVKCCSKSSH